ncbi:hypothetical protein EV202_10629 [Bacteroides heparinolyticus]|uniref:Uncharacterized protein n=1 Tax=Prevotella heparinolytica TaxID=28113 RepID=A0A4R2LNK5_9BACE|nr:hypothetical protein EV202_10629 [Bacteroides heparinolyticus]
MTQLPLAHNACVRVGFNLLAPVVSLAGTGSFTCRHRKFHLLKPTVLLAETDCPPCRSPKFLAYWHCKTGVAMEAEIRLDVEGQVRLNRSNTRRCIFQIGVLLLFRSCGIVAVCILGLVGAVHVPDGSGDSSSSCRSD